MSSPASIRLIPLTNPSPLFKSDGRYADFLSQNFDDSSWHHISSFAELDQSSILKEIPLSDLIGSTAPKELPLGFFPSLTPAQDTERYLSIIRTTFSSSELNNSNTISLSYEGGHTIAFFVNGTLIGSNFPIQKEQTWGETEPEISAYPVYKVPQSVLKPENNTLVIVSPLSTWFFEPVRKVFITDNPNEASRIGAFELVRVAIPNSFTAASILLFLFFLLLSIKNTDQKGFAAIAWLALCSAGTYAFLGGTWALIPLHVVYQRKILSFAAMCFSAWNIKLTASCFEMEHIKIASDKAIQRVFWGFSILGLVFAIGINRHDITWNLSAAMLCAVFTIPSILTLWSVFKKGKKLSPLLWSLAVAHIVVLLTALETYLNFRYRYWKGWTALWSFLPLLLVSALHYNHKFRERWQELSELRNTLESRVQVRTMELEQVTQRLRKLLTRAKSASSAQDHRSRLQEVGTLSMHLDHKIRNPLMVMQLALEEAEIKIQEDPQNANDALKEINQIAKNIGVICEVLDSLRIFRRHAGNDTLKQEVGARRKRTRRRPSTAPQS